LREEALVARRLEGTIRDLQLQVEDLSVHIYPGQVLRIPVLD